MTGFITARKYNLQIYLFYSFFTNFNCVVLYCIILFSVYIQYYFHLLGIRISGRAIDIVILFGHALVFTQLIQGKSTVRCTFKVHN